MQAIIGFVLGVATVLLLREATRKETVKPPKRSAENESPRAWREYRNFLEYDGNEQEDITNG